jgi:hypothetical protein
MGRPCWHRRVERVLERVGRDWGYEILRPRVIHFVHSGYAQFEYHPDVCWLYRGRKKDEPNAIIWEIESGYPDFKRICGDFILAAEVISKYVHCYPWKGESLFGLELSEDMIYELSGKKRKKITYKKGERLLIHPNAEALFIVVENYEEDFRRYIHTIRKITGFIEDAEVFAVPKKLYGYQVENRIRRLKHLREHYK